MTCISLLQRSVPSGRSDMDSGIAGTLQMDQQLEEASQPKITRGSLAGQMSRSCRDLSYFQMFESEAGSISLSLIWNRLGIAPTFLKDLMLSFDTVGVPPKLPIRYCPRPEVMESQVQGDFRPRPSGTILNKKASLSKFDLAAQTLTWHNNSPSFKGARSLNGCWTCRVRRKKCDESLPSCLSCSGLSLTCDGYGTRLVWLDGGSLEKAKALKIKSIVKQTIKRRARSLSGPVSSRKEAYSQTLLPTSSSFCYTSPTSSLDEQSIREEAMHDTGPEAFTSSSWERFQQFDPNNNLYDLEEPGLYFPTMRSVHREEAHDKDSQGKLTFTNRQAHSTVPVPERIAFNMQPPISPSADLALDSGKASIQGMNDPYLDYTPY